MDFKLIRGCNVSKIAQLKYRGFCCFSWELISHHKDVLLVRLPVSTVSPSIVLTLLSAADLQAEGVTPASPRLQSVPALPLRLERKGRTVCVSLPTSDASFDFLNQDL